MYARYPSPPSAERYVNLHVHLKNVRNRLFGFGGIASAYERRNASWSVGLAVNGLGKGRVNDCVKDLEVEDAKWRQWIV